MAIRGTSDATIKGGLKKIMAECRSLVICSDIPTTSGTIMSHILGWVQIGTSNYHKSSLTDGLRLSLVGLPLVSYTSSAAKLKSKSVVLCNGDLTKFLTLTCTEHEFVKGQKIEIDDFHIDITADDTSRTLSSDWVWGSYDAVMDDIERIDICTSKPASYSDIALKSMAHADIVPSRDMEYVGTGNSLQLRVKKRTTGTVSAAGTATYAAVSSAAGKGDYGVTSLDKDVTVQVGDAFAVDPTTIEISFPTTAADVGVGAR